VRTARTGAAAARASALVPRGNSRRPAAVVQAFACIVPRSSERGLAAVSFLGIETRRQANTVNRGFDW